MSLKRSWIGLRYWFTKRWRMLYCCLALVCFAFILITSKNENFNNQLTSNEQTNQHLNSKTTVSLRQSLTAFNVQSPSFKSSSSKSLAKNEQTSITDRLNNMIRNTWTKLNNYYSNYSNYYSNYITKADPEFQESNLITLFSSAKFQKFNEIDFNINQPVLQMKISDHLKSQLDLIVRRLIENHENIYNLNIDKRINKSDLTINLIQQMLDRQMQNEKYLTISYTDQWQPVIGPKEKSRVYSAYYEPRLENGKFVRVIGAARTVPNFESLYCALWFIENKKLKLLMTPAINRAIRENWNLRYSAYYSLCPLGDHNTQTEIPIGVSILKKKLPVKNSNEEDNEINPNLKDEINEQKSEPNKVKEESDEFVFHALGNFILVQNNLKYKKNETTGNDDDKIAVCVKPLHYEYNKLDNMIEFIELNQILGIDHFLFYNHTVGPKVDCLLNHYTQNTNLVTILPWHNLDMKSQKEIRTEGIFASLNDCLYRTMYRFKYVAMIDLDEFIIPHLDSNLKVLLNRLTNFSLSKDRVGAFSFQNGFFYLQWLDDQNYSELTKQDEKNQLPIYLTTLAKSRRRSALHNHRERSKLIVKPEVVVEVGNHFVWQFLPTKSSFHISEKAAYLHHYRICEFGGSGCLDTSSIIDYRTKYWSKQLIQKSISTYKIYNQTCLV